MFSFGIALFSHGTLTALQLGIAIGSLVVSIVFLFCAMLSSYLPFFDNPWMSAGIGTFVYMGWFLTFALDWLDGINGIKGTPNAVQLIVSYLGIFWILAVLMLVTRAFASATENSYGFRRWIPLAVPLVVFVQTIQVFVAGNKLGGLIMIVLFAGSMAIALRWWKPIGELPF